MKLPLAVSPLLSASKNATRRPRRGFAATMVLAAIALFMAVPAALAQCPELGPLQNYTAGVQTACPCFIPGEQAGVVLQAPANEYPIEILKIGIFWGSSFGGAPQQIEQALYIYEGGFTGGVPTPSGPIFTLLGPVLNDGFINQFDISAVPGNKTIMSGPFTVTLEFLNENLGDPFAGTVVNDGNGCQAGKNVVYAIPGGWADACVLGVSGDWLMYVTYRSLSPNADANPTSVLFASAPAYQATCDTVYVSNTGCGDLDITGIGGCDMGAFSIDSTGTSHTIAPNDSTPIIVCVTPTMTGADACTLSVANNSGNNPIEIPVQLNDVTAVGDPGAPSAELSEITVYPNPFNPTATIRFTLPAAMRVSSEVFGVDGRLVKTLLHNEVFPAGEVQMYWNGLNNDNEPVASGVYLIRVATPVGNRVTRAILLK